MTELSLAGRVAGCLLGGACGDALGAPLEFLGSAAIRELDPTSIATMMPAYKRKGGAITDDTQMTLFSAEALIEIASSGTLDATEQLQIVADAYLLRARNNSKGCGTVMRAAPFGLVDQVELAGPASDLTHGHPTASGSSVALAMMINQLVLGSDLPAAVASTVDELQGLNSPAQRETLEMLQIAVRLADGGPPSQDVVESLGAGWVAEEALAIAVLCALAGDGWEDTLVRAVAHGGDSDSTGALAGNLLGAALGPSEIPPGWLDKLEARSTIEETAKLLALAA